MPDGPRNRLRIGLVSEWDLDDPQAWSGTILPMRRALEDRADVTPLQVTATNHVLERALGRATVGSRRGRYLSTIGPLTARRRAREVRRAAWHAGRLDVIVGLSASSSLARLASGPPVVQVTDATFRALIGFYPDFQDVHPLSLRQGWRQAQQSMARTAAFVVNNAWARDALHADGYPDDRITLAPFGPVISPLAPCLPRDGQELRVLVVARDWRRKGGDHAVSAIEALRASGVPATLSVVGSAPEELPEWVDALGRLEPSALSAVYADHDVLLELATANAAGTTLTDAAAHGLPAIATDVGGVSTIVRHGVTGLLVEPGPGLAERAAHGLRELCDDGRRASMAAAAIAHQRTSMTWEGWAAAVEETCRAAISGVRSRRV